MLLWMSAQLNRFSSNQWLTYKQSKALGGQGLCFRTQPTLSFDITRRLGSSRAYQAV
jgi:hypothetical protein